MDFKTQSRQGGEHFRADINGLRALAVLLVVVCHLEYSNIKAGFLGVDVFLVISGYLISRNILNDLKLKRFSLSAFYIKRFKRLFPALFVTLSISLFAGYLVLAPANLEALGKSVISGVFFYSNIFFLSETGYFDTEAAFKPLLHIWSLSLEEQFYFVWPVLLMLLFKLARRLLFLLMFLIILASAGTAELYNNSHPEAAFYLLPFRFFEFLMGAVCIWLEQHKTDKRYVAELFVGIGLLLITVSAIIFSPATQMPGMRSFIPCAGTMMVIYGGNTRYAGWLLRNNISALIGKSSYSVYLVHWPLIVYYKYYTLTELDWSSKLILGLLSLFLGFLMWRFVENTFRKSNYKVGSIDVLWIWMPACMILISTLAWQVWIHHGFPSRYGDDFIMTSEELVKNRERYWEGIGSGNAVLQGSLNKKIIVMGNSHAIDLIYALRKNGLQEKIIFYPTSNYCLNFGAVAIDKKDDEKCRAIKLNNLADTNWKSARAIFLFDNWPSADMSSLKTILNEIRTLSDKPIYVFGPKMTFVRQVPELVHSCRSSSPYAINRFAQEYKTKSRELINSELKKFFSDPVYKNRGIYFVDVLNVLKNGDNRFDIISSETSNFLYFDADHYTEQGAIEFGAKLRNTYPEIFIIK